MQKKGFTLIELLVVIAIIGILAAIGVTAFGGAQAKARDSKRRADIGNIMTSLTLYVDNKTYYPTNAASGVPDQTATAATPFQTAADDTTVGFSIPKSPSAGTPTNISNYWYIAESSATPVNASTFTRLESVASWFVSNSRGFSGDISNACGGAACDLPSGANTECAIADSSVAFEPCRANPDMVDP